MSETLPSDTSFMEAHEYAVERRCCARRAGRELWFYKGLIFTPDSVLIGKLKMNPDNSVDTTQLHKLFE